MNTLRLARSLKAKQPFLSGRSNTVAGLAKSSAAPALPGRPVWRSVSTHAAAGTSSGRSSWDIRMLYDGDCPLCMREVNMLKNRDAGKNKIDFVDISSPTYSAADNAGISYEQAMGRIHAILPDGKIVTDVEVFRRLYEAVGLGWIYAITKWEPAGKAADALYSVWAKYRMEVTGREPLAVVLEKRRARMAGGEGVAMCRTDDATSMAAADCSSSSSSKEATASSARS